MTPQQYREYKAKDPAHAREVNLRAVRRWQAKNPDKTRAHHAVQRAVKAGIIEKYPCGCGEKKVEGHHIYGYMGGDILRVVWLCRVHHASVHRREVEEINEVMS
jgi:hypothetical protein